MAVIHYGNTYSHLFCLITPSPAKCVILQPAVVGGDSGECRSITPENQNLLCFGAFEFSINEFREPVAYSIVFNSDSRFNGTARVRTFTTQIMFR